MSRADEPLNADEIAEVRSRVARCRAARKKPGRYTEFDSRILATIDLLTSRLDAATRRADEVEKALGAARLLLFAAHPSSELPGRYIVSKHDIDTLRAAVHRLDAALSTGSTPATTANPGDKADRIDAAKEGRHA